MSIELNENQLGRLTRGLVNVGERSREQSNSNIPFVSGRQWEKVFAAATGATDNARRDDSADSIIGDVGIGLKTWVNGTNNQKVAEFNKLRSEYANLDDLSMVKYIANARNERIAETMENGKLNDMEYIICKRTVGNMSLYRHVFPKVDVDNIELLPKQNKASIHFTDGKHTYRFVKSKSTLYMMFDELEEIISFPVTINENFLKDICA